MASIQTYYCHPLLSLPPYVRTQNTSTANDKPVTPLLFVFHFSKRQPAGKLNRDSVGQTHTALLHNQHCHST